MLIGYIFQPEGARGGLGRVVARRTHRCLLYFCCYGGGGVIHPIMATGQQTKRKKGSETVAAPRETSQSGSERQSRVFIRHSLRNLLEVGERSWLLVIAYRGMLETQ